MKASEAQSISQLQAYVAQLYPNEDRDFSYIYGYCSRHLGFIGKCITQSRHPNDEFMRASAWLLALANKLEIDVMKSLTARYPSVCPYCLSAPCTCRIDNKVPSNGIPAYKIPEELFYKSEALLREGDISFDASITRLRKVYPGNQATWETIGGWKLSAKIQEELAEVHEAAARYYAGSKKIDAVGEEFADLFAWFLSAWTLSTDGLSFDDSFREYFATGCPVCGNDVACECKRFSDAGSRIVEPSSLDELGDVFSRLASEVGLDTEETDEILKSLKAASETQSEPVAVNAVNETKSAVDRIESGLDRTTKNAKNASALIVAVKALLSHFPM